jgi:serine/threonine protein kinase
LKKLGHNEFTVKFYEIHETKSSIFIVQEYLEGGTLLENVIEQRPAENIVKSIMRRLMKCL